MIFSTIRYAIYIVGEIPPEPQIKNLYISATDQDTINISNLKQNIGINVS